MTRAAAIPTRADARTTTTAVRIVPLHGLAPEQRALLRAGAREAGAVYTVCMQAHKIARHTRSPWPSYVDLHHLTKGRHPDLCAQSVQATGKAFDGTIKSTVANRKAGNTTMRYPWKERYFQPIRWPVQALQRKRDGTRFPLGGIGKNRRYVDLPIHLPHNAGACQIIWNHGQYELHVCVTHEGAVEASGCGRGCVDLGEIHAAALVTDTGTGLIVSGRGIRTIKQGRNRAIGELQKKQARCTRHSRQWTKYQRARDRINGRTERQVRDLRHKGARLVIEQAEKGGVGELYVGNPDGVRRHKTGRRHNQRMAQWEYGTDIGYLKEKGAGVGMTVRTGPERGTSSTCPNPTCRHKQNVRGRRWVCRQCGGSWHRDLVGATNMFALAFGDTATVLVPERQNITYRRPGPVGLRQRGRAGNARRSSPDRGLRGTPIPTELITSAVGHPPIPGSAKATCGMGPEEHTLGVLDGHGSARAALT
jgi:putative transposase